jgi:Ca-activated chloride channel homolog
MKEKLQYIRQYLKTHKKLFIVLVIIKLLIKIGIAGYLILGTSQCKAQSTNKMIRSGNNLYHKQKYNNATEQYTKALQQDPKNGPAFFNQSDALYQLKEYQKAGEQFTAITQSGADPGVKAKAYHNLGNCLYKEEKYEACIKAYKECLKLNPSDQDTKYNLMMAMAKLKNNQGGGGSDQQQQDQKNKKDQQQNKDQQQQNKDQQQQQSKQPQMSNEEAQRLLEALSNEENKVQQKLEKKKGEPQNGKVQKDW